MVNICTLKANPNLIQEIKPRVVSVSINEISLDAIVVRMFKDVSEILEYMFATELEVRPDM